MVAKYPQQSTMQQLIPGRGGWQVAYACDMQCVNGILHALISISN